MIWSMILSLLTITVVPVSSDDQAILIHAVTGATFHENLWAQCPGWVVIVRWAYHLFGGHLMAYRLLSMIPALAGYWILASGQSRLARNSLALLVWTPIAFESMRTIRYDGVGVLLMACYAKSIERSFK